MKKYYRKRYVLGTGYPFVCQIGEDGISLGKDREGNKNVNLRFPPESLWDFDKGFLGPKYRLILERIRPSKARKK